MNKVDKITIKSILLFISIILFSYSVYILCDVQKSYSGSSFEIRQLFGIYLDLILLTCWVSLIFSLVIGIAMFVLSFFKKPAVKNYFFAASVFLTFVLLYVIVIYLISKIDLPKQLANNLKNMSENEEAYQKQMFYSYIISKNFFNCLFFSIITVVSSLISGFIFNSDSIEWKIDEVLVSLLSSGENVSEIESVDDEKMKDIINNRIEIAKERVNKKELKRKEKGLKKQIKLLELQEKLNNLQKNNTKIEEEKNLNIKDEK